MIDTGHVTAVRVIQGDITQLQVDAVVNAANERLLGGSGVDGAIHRKAGPQLLQACRQLPEVRPGVRCPVGEARVTPGFNLPARLVIHTVGPIYHGGANGEAGLLAACYRNALSLAEQHEVRSIAFPAISCGVYRYPPAEAAGIAVSTIRAHLAGSPSGLELVQLVAFDRAMVAVLDRAAS